MKRLAVLLSCLLTYASLSPLATAQVKVPQTAPAAVIPSEAARPPARLLPKSKKAAREQGDLNTLAGSGQLTAGTGTVEPRTEVNAGAISAVPPSLTPEQIEAREERELEFENVPVRAGAPAPPATLSPPTEAGESGLTTPDGGVQPAAPNDMVYFRVHSFTGAEVPTSQRSTIQEPTAVNVGNSVFFTGNWYAAKSADAGATFSYLNPSTLFPSVNGGFCCDQVTAYAPAQDMVLWGLQYIKNTSTGTLRIARAIGSTGLANNSWLYYDFTPQHVGFATGNWFDYPSFTVGSNYLYVTSNVYSTSTDTFAGSVVLRLPLASLAAGTSLSYSYFVPATSQGTFRCTEGATTTMYCASFNTTTQMRVHRWSEGSSTIFWDDVNLNAFGWLNRNGVATSPDGTNWAARADSRPTAAYVANGVIGVMFTAAQDGTHPYPYTIHARFNEGTRALISQGQIWNPNYAWMYPSAAPNSVGNLAGTLQIGGGTVGNGFPYPGTQIWVSDDVSPGGTTVGAVFSLANSNAGPSSNGWGDFFSVRPHKTFPNTWVAAAHILNNGQTGSATVPVYSWFGRERDGAAPCTYSLNATGAPFDAAGGTGLVVVGTQAGCNWTATSNATWITITNGSTGSGTGNVNYTVAANTTGATRIGTMTIAGQTFTVTQTGTSCTFSISPTSASFTSSGGTGNVSVTTQAGCSWLASSNATWITITSGSSGTGSGTAAIFFAISGSS